MKSIDELTSDIKDLIPLPKAYVRIQQLVNDPDSSLDEITEVIVHDPGLTSRILRIANSAYMALATKVDTVSRAVQVLGLNQVHDLALAGAAVGSLFKIQSTALDVSDFWRRSVYSAVVGRAFSKHAGVSAPERAFVCGLLHDIGTLLFAYREPEAYSDMFQKAAATDTPLSIIQKETFGFEYAEVSAALLQQWQLPEAIIEPVRYHTDKLSSAPDEYIADTAVVHAAAIIARGAMWRSDEDEPVPEFEQLAVTMLGIDDESTKTCMTEADSAVVEAMTLLLPNTKSKIPKAK